MTALGATLRCPRATSCKAAAIDTMDDQNLQPNVAVLDDSKALLLVLGPGYAAAVRHGRAERPLSL
jgi:hypothetical protein